MVALGGSIVVYGEKSDGSDWNVGIQDPNGKDGEVLGGSKSKAAQAFQHLEIMKKHLQIKRQANATFIS